MTPFFSVSVIIPTFNRAWSIQKSIDSVLSQTYPHFELTVIDDGSKDETLSILESYGTSIRILRQERKGVSAARNRGIRETRSEFVAFLDSDDLWLEDKLKAQMEFFERNPACMICQTEEIWIRNGKRVNPKVRHKKPSGMMFEESLALCLISPSAVMIRRDLLNQVGLFDESLPACEDYDLWLRICCQHPVGLIDLPLVVKTGGHDDQLSKMPVLDRYRIHAIEKILSGEKLTPTQRENAIKTLIEKCRIIANGCQKRGRSEESAYYKHLIARYETTGTP